MISAESKKYERSLVDNKVIKWCEFQDTIDERGRLTAIEGNEHIPFNIKRVFYIHQVVSGNERGGHAHRETDQVLIGINGSIIVDICDGINTRTFTLDDPKKGLYVPRMHWIRFCAFKNYAICLILANTHYDRSKSVRTWDEYLQLRGI